MFDNCDVVLVERQMRSKFKEMATAIRCFNWEKTVLGCGASEREARVQNRHGQARHQ